MTMVGCPAASVRVCGQKHNLFRGGSRSVFGPLRSKHGTYFLVSGNGNQLLFCRFLYLQGVILNHSIYVICSIARL
jgi:hypothetical protein